MVIKPGAEERKNT